MLGIKILLFIVYQQLLLRQGSEPASPLGFLQRQPSGVSAFTSWSFEINGWTIKFEMRQKSCQKLTGERDK